MREPGPITVVTGLGRCGTSLLMQMLHAGGYPIYEPPQGPVADGSFEGDTPCEHWTPAEWASPSSGALKSLMPSLLLHAIPRDRLDRMRFLFLRRDVSEQARSQLKMAALTHELASNRPNRRRYTALLRQDVKKTWSLLRATGRPLLVLRFEDLLSDPLGTAYAIKLWSGDKSLDVDAMARVVIPRSPKCQPGFEIEAQVAGLKPRRSR